MLGNLPQESVVRARVCARSDMTCYIYIYNKYIYIYIHTYTEAQLSLSL